MTIKVVRVKRGEAPDTVDRLAVHMSECGLYAWSGVVASEDQAIFGGSDPEFESAREAERAALTWAAHHGATEVMLEADDA